MATKHILMLGFIAATALTLALLGQPHPQKVSSPGTTTLATSSTGATPTPDVHSPISKKEENTAMAHPAPATSFSAATTAERTQYRPQIHLTIVEPEGRESFDVDLINGDDLCDDLKEAKLEGDIHSLTLDSSYMSTFGSLYVREINGYSNNWTVKVNGSEPEGCSLYKPKAGDQITWRFGV